MYGYNGRYKVSSIQKGALLEGMVKSIFDKEAFVVKVHKVFDSGLDFEACKNSLSVIGECVNWRSGYIHRLRFLSIIGNLSKSATCKYFICLGVKPTLEQHRILHAMKVKVVHYKTQMLEQSTAILHYLRSKLLGVITLNSVCARNVFSSSFVAGFCCDCFRLSIFEWWRRLWKGKFLRGFRFRGGFVSET